MLGAAKPYSRHKRVVEVVSSLCSSATVNSSYQEKQHAHSNHSRSDLITIHDTHLALYKSRNVAGLETSLSYINHVHFARHAAPMKAAHLSRPFMTSIHSTRIQDASTDATLRWRAK
jgi:hypothetical protein